MAERIGIEKCIQVGNTLCNGCEVVDEAREMLIQNQFEPIADTLREVGGRRCPEEKHPEFRVEGNLIPAGRRRVMRMELAREDIPELVEVAV